MISFAFVDADGIPTGGGRERDLPEGAVVLEPPFTLGDLAGLRYVDGVWIAREDRSEEYIPSRAEVAAQEAELAAAWIARARGLAVERINAAAGRVRLRIYTDIPGQDALYLEKRAEAEGYVRQVTYGSEPETLADYPLLANEIGITARDAWQLAQIWLNRSDQFKRVGAATEQARMKALIAVSTAPDEKTIESIETTFNEALNGLSL